MHSLPQAGLRRCVSALPDKRFLVCPKRHGIIVAFLLSRSMGAAEFSPCELDWLRQVEVRLVQAAGKEKAEPGPLADAAHEVLRRGKRLAKDLEKRGVKCNSFYSQLASVETGLGQSDLTPDRHRGLYLTAQRAVRTLAFENPLLDFDDILFVKGAPTLFPHVSDQYYGWWSRGGGGLYILSGYKGNSPRLRCLTDTFAKGNFLRPELSYDGERVLFAYCKHYPHVADIRDKTCKQNLPEDAFYHLYEMNLDGTEVRRVTRGHYDDFDGRYLPNGDIVFLSTRKGTALQAGRYSAAATLEAIQPDSYVRCGGGSHRPVAVFTLHRIKADGSGLTAISAFENFEWTPALAHDGRILYARWDYIDRFNGHFMSLWATTPDGTKPELVYGNYTKKPQCVFEARAIPNSRKLIFTAAAHHSITGGSLVLFDRTRGLEFEEPLARLTPDVCFPETEGWPKTYYAAPWPLSEEHFLCSWSDRPLPGHALTKPDDPRNPANASGIYLLDAFGNMNLLHRDAQLSSNNPIPVRPRPRPPQLPDMTQWDGPQRGTFLVQDVYRGLAGVERGVVARLRVVGVLPKVQPHMNNPALSVSREDTGKFILGTVPVEKDGSAHFRVPSGVPVFFQALDSEGRCVQTMRSLTYVQPGTSLSCIGCHESRESAPAATGKPLAHSRAASKLKLDPSGSWPLRYDALVQPVLDRHCVKCHVPGSDNVEAAKLDLTAKTSYNVLMTHAGSDLHALVLERDRSIVGDQPALKSKVYAALGNGKHHKDVKLSAEDRYRFAVWMDTYGHRQGAFSGEQEEQVREFQVAMKGIIE